MLAAYLISKGTRHAVAHPQGDGWPSIVNDFDGSLGVGRRTVPNRHMDVFPAGGGADWDLDPWSGDVDGDRLHGSGVVNMKSGTASLEATYASLHEAARLRDAEC